MNHVAQVVDLIRSGLNPGEPFSGTWSQQVIDVSRPD
jgi:hypothetical protein